LKRYTIPYGYGHLAFELPEHFNSDIITAPVTPAASNPENLVENALDFLIGIHSIREFSGAQTAAIAINDKTRPVPHADLLPPLLRRLNSIGISSENIRFIIANGAHPPMKSNEYSKILPQEILSTYKVHSHDATDKNLLVWKGTTSRGTPIWINKYFIDADLRIVVGNIEPHQFQGFSGGVKSAAIGLAGEETINKNHAMMISENARLGEYDRNPARQDIEEIGRCIGVNFALNAILNQEKRVVQVIAGTPQEVMKAGIPVAKQVCQVNVGFAYDLIIASPGGHPKDINLYQAQKSLAHARLIIKAGGTIILAAACPEGTGSQHYENWVRRYKSHEQVIENFRREGFQLGVHKAFQISRDAVNIKLWLLSEMPTELVRSLILEPLENLDSGISKILAGDTLGSTRIGIMPYANTTIPFLVS
jgi:nickel-dependent lactate racemase